MQEDIVQTLMTAGAVPVIGALVALFFGRLGVGGRIQRFELIEKKLAVLNSISCNDQIDQRLCEKLREEVEMAIRQTISAPEDIDDDKLSQEIETAFGADAPLTHQSLKRVDQFSWLRRWIFLPVTPTLLGWIAITVYYYLLLVWCGVISIAFVPVESEAGVTDVSELEITLILLAFAVAGFWISRLIILGIYRRYLRDTQYQRWLASRSFATRAAT